MFFVLSKTIAFLAKPIEILLLLTLLMMLSKNRTKRKRLGLVFLITFYCFSCPLIIDWLMKQYETPTQSIDSTPNYTYGIVLTGGLINESKSIGNKLHVGSQADRLWQAVELYKDKKIKKIIISGGDGYHKITPNTPTENDKAKEFLIKSGVSSGDIIQEIRAVNTYENAKFSRELLERNSQKVLIITSGFHLKRALACFKKQKIDADGFACAPISENYDIKWQDIFPSMDAFRNSDIIANEIIGLIIYKALGYI
jgi:uncharacterized SAM-binding protein YcdF (DUF218 family)